MTANIERQLPVQPFFTPLEIADILKVEKRTVLGWLRSPTHKLRGVKLGNALWRVSREEFVRYLEEEYGHHSSP